MWLFLQLVENIQRFKYDWKCGITLLLGCDLPRRYNHPGVGNDLKYS